MNFNNLQAMYFKLYNENPNPKEVLRLAEILRNGGVIIYPTDTIYAVGCDITQSRAVERVARIKNVKPEKANFSFICHDLSQLSDYCKPISNGVFKLMKKNLPGAFTFILDANNQVPKLFKNKKKSVGIRVPNSNIIREIVKELGHPVLTTSIHDEDEILEYSTDPELIYEKFGSMVDAVIDGGYGGNMPSTVVNCTGGDIEIIRQGKGELID